MKLISNYTDLVASENKGKPSFISVVQSLVSPLVDSINLNVAMSGFFDLDSAVGAQLDVIGEWVGVDRRISIPLVGVYFAFDVTGLGFEQGSWLGPYDPTTGMSLLPDDSYRILIRARIGVNRWDGTVAGLLAILLAVFVGATTKVFAIDNQDMTMSVGIAGGLPSAVNLALIKGGYIVPKPSGVLVFYTVTSVDGAPLFGFDVQNSYISGFDTGAWGV
jgi:hypothetical protein